METKIFVVVEGGVVTAVYGKVGDEIVTVIDHDHDGDEEGERRATEGLEALDDAIQRGEVTVIY